MIDDFKANLGKRGFAKPTLFRVEFTNIPGILQHTSGASEIIKDLHFFAETAEFPGTQILTQEIRYYDMPAKIAYGKVHDDLNITFRLDRDFQVKRMFDVWVDAIYNRQTGDMRYKQTYVGSLQIYQIMENGYSSYAVEFEEVFPTQIGQISLGWDQSSTYSRLAVTFTFRRMKVIANKMIFRKPKFATTNGIMGGERTIDEPLTKAKTRLTAMLDNDLSAFRQINVMNQTNLSGFFSGIDFA